MHERHIILNEYDVHTIYKQLIALIELIYDNCEIPTVTYGGMKATVKSIEFSHNGQNVNILFHIMYDDLSGEWIEVWPKSTEILYMFVRELIVQARSYDEDKLLEDLNEARKMRYGVAIHGNRIHTYEILLSKVMQQQIPFVYDGTEYRRIHIL